MARVVMTAVHYDTSGLGLDSSKLLDFCWTECTSREGMTIYFLIFSNCALIMLFDTMQGEQSGNHHYKN